MAHRDFSKYFQYGVRFVKEQWKRTCLELKSGEPIQVGRALTKIFLLFVLILLLLPQRNEKGWGWRFTDFIFSPSNEIGDTLAGIAGVLAFLWIIVTVWLQSQELKAQREELKNQRIEFETMNSTLSDQMFESTFFALVSTLDQIVNSMDLRNRQSSDNVATGRDCFKTFYNDLKNYYAPPLPFEDSRTLPEAYEQFWKQHQSDLAHYFRFLHNAFRFISESGSKKPHHGRLLRAMLSDYELIILFYNCIDKRGEGFVVYAREFRLFDNLPREKLLSTDHEQNLDDLLAGDSIAMQA